MDLTGHNICVLDIETLYSADDCLLCQQQEGAHDLATHPFQAIGWGNKAALQISIGCYFDYQTARLRWFDMATLAETVSLFVKRKPLLVSFNGIQFDFALMRALLHFGKEDAGTPALMQCCDAFKTLCATSYDILAALWRADPSRKVERGLNSLGAISVANGYGEKEMDGAQAPRLWRAGRVAEVIAYNVGDVLKTKALFEQILATGSILRSDGLPIALPRPLREGL